MPRKYQAVDAIEPIHDTMVEQFGNFANYNVVDGCDITYSTTALSATVSAGHVTHNGIKIAVPEAAVSFTADGSNPRWVWIGINSTGAAVATEGTAAADPAVPEYSSDQVPLALLKVEPAQTAASAVAYKLDKHVYGPTAPSSSAVVLSADAPWSTSDIGLSNIPGLRVAVAASTSYLFRAIVHYTATTTSDYYFKITLPAGATYQAVWTYTYSFNGSTVVGANSHTTSYIKVQGYGTSQPGVIAIYGTVTTSTTAGHMQFQHSQSGAVTKAQSRIELF